MEVQFIKITEQLKLPCEGITAMWNTIKVNPNGMNQKRIIVVTDFNVYVFKTKLFGDDIIMCKCYPLEDIKSITANTKQGVILEFKKGVVKIKDPEVEGQLIETIQSQLCRLLTDSELPIKIPRRVQIDPILRLERHLLQEDKFDVSLVKLLTVFMNNKTSTLKLSYFTSFLLKTLL